MKERLDKFERKIDEVALSYKVSLLSLGVGLMALALSVISDEGSNFNKGLSLFLIGSSMIHIDHGRRHKKNKNTK